MAKRKKKAAVIPQSSTKAGLPPGTLVHIGEKKTDKTRITIIDYDKQEASELPCEHVADLRAYINKPTVTWINIDGLHDIDLISGISEQFGIHPLVTEDILNTEHRPKVEDFPGYLFISLKMLGLSTDGESVISEQVSLILGSSWVLSFQEQEGDIFDGIRTRIRENKGTIRQFDADYLLYRLLDTIVDNYFFIIEQNSLKIEDVESRVINDFENVTIAEIQQLKKKLIDLKRTILPLREVLSFLIKDVVDEIQKGTTRFLQDVYDHIIQVVDTIESQRDMVASLRDMYQSTAADKMNQVMKTLTIIATIFIPLTFIAGIYGMNFQYIPELQFKYGYHVVWGVMILMTILMVIYFRRKKWF